MPFRRYFGDVRLGDFDFRPDSDNFASLMKILEIIGSRVIELTIKDSTGRKVWFLDMLRLTKNVQKISISGVRIDFQPNGEHQKQHNFPHLKSLELINIANFGAIQEAFDQVDFLQYLRLQSMKTRANRLESYLPLLFRQKKLNHLELVGVKVQDFEWEKINSPKKLGLKDLTFLQKEAFESFMKFIKTLDNVRELELYYMYDRPEKKNYYREILTHFLNLRTLNKLKHYDRIEGVISGLQICNLAVTAFNTDENRILRFFPNLQMLHVKDISDSDDFTGMAWIKSLTEIEIDGMDFQKLDMIKCPRLRKFLVKKIWSYQRDSTVFQMFTQNNPAIEDLELCRSSLPKITERDNRQVIVAKDVAHLITNLPKLSIFKMSGAKNSNTMEFARLVGENIKKLTHLELAVREYEESEVTEYFQINLPHYKIAVKKITPPCKVLTVKKI
jgi:hypothetical protein